MKYLKIQWDLLKAADARDCKGKRFDFPWFETDDKIFVCSQGHYFIAIPKCMFYLDKERVFDRKPYQNGEKFLDVDNLSLAYNTHTLIEGEVRGKKTKFHKFAIGEESVYLDENNLKYFDLEDSTYKGMDKKTPIYIFELGELVGIVLPIVNVKEER